MFSFLSLNSCLCYLLLLLSGASWCLTSSSQPPAWMFDIRDAVEVIERNRSSFSKSPSKGVQKVCYPEFGCFTTGDKISPFAHTGLLPQPPEVLQTAFYAFTPASQEHPKLVLRPNSDVQGLLQLLLLQKNSAKTGPADQPKARKVLAVIVHGYGMSYRSYGFFDLKDALLEHGANGELGVVVLSVQWKEGARTGSPAKFAQACTNVQLVGAQLGHLLAKIRSKLSKELDSLSISLYCIGYSLGAHVCSFAGRFTQEQANFSLDRITGLDPNWALFEGHPGSHLRPSDALFVDVLHTSAGKRLMAGEHGFSEAVGHADFYLNGGAHQPMCEQGVDASNLVCDHFSGVQYYIASLTASLECTFIGYPQEGGDGGKHLPKVMGFWSYRDEEKEEEEGDKSSSNISIKYYLNTTDHYPYCD